MKSFISLEEAIDILDANELNISEMPYDSILEKDNWDMTFPLIRNAQKCIKCMRCVQICDNIQEMHIWDVVNTGSRTTVNVRGNQNIRETACTLCGQCVVNCPVLPLAGYSF